MSKYLDDLLVLGGCGAIVYGTSLWSIIAAWYVAGVILILLGVVVMLGARKGNRG